MGERGQSNPVLSATRFHEGAGVAGGSASRGSMTSTLGFDLEDDAWMGLVRESVTPRALGDFAGYQLLGEIGRGAQGAVFRAVQPGTGRQVALKHIAAGPLAGAAAKERFEREVSVLSALRHPAIVSVYGVIETPPPLPHAALVMEFVDGVPMDEWARGKAMRERVQAMEVVCGAIAYAHQRGVIHRDIKPSNVLVDRDDQPRVLDFGLAALMGARDGPVARASRASVVGTPAFAAPEQVIPGIGGVDTRSDVYALGVLLYVSLTGSLPHGHEGAVRGAVAPSPARVERSVPADLCAIVMTAMAPEPALRYQSADAMQADLRRWLAGEAVLAHPPTLAYRVGKVIRRRPLLCSLVALSVLGVAASAVVSTVLAARLAARGDALAAAVKQSEASAESAKANAAKSQTLAQTLRQTLESVSESVAASAPGSVFHVTQEATAKIEQIDAEADPALVESLWYDVGRVASKLNDVTVSEQAVSCGMPLAERVYGTESVQYGRWVMLDGLCRERAQDNAGAEARYRRGYEILRRAAGEVTEDTGWAANNWGIMLFNLGQFDASERVLTEALFIRVAVYGERHFRVAETLRNLGSMERTRRNFDSARRYYDLSIGAFPADTPETDPIRLGTVHNQIRLLREEGKVDEAIAETTRLITLLSASEDPRSPGLGRFYDLRSQLYRRQHRYEEAVADCLLRDACVIIAPVDHPTRVSRSVNTIHVLVEAGRLDEAESKARAALKELEDLGKAGTDAWKSFDKALKGVEGARARSVTPQPQR